MSIQTVEIALPTGIDSVAVGLAEPIAIIEIRQGPVGPGGSGSSTWNDLTGTADAIPFTLTTAPAHSEGLVYYDEDDHSLTYYVDEADVSMNIGREMWIRVRNNSGSTILNGKVVYLSGATGQTPTIALARADSLTTSRVIGIATHDIENNSFGYVTTAGEVKGLDTSAFLDGAMLYLSAATAGELTATAPTAPNRIIQVATVSHAHITQGKLYAHPESDSIDSTGIADSTATGRALVTAANAAAARSTLGAAASGANTDITSMTGLGLGTVSSPTFTFGDADSGFYAPNSTSIAYAVDGVQKFRFDSAGMTVTSPGGAASRTLTVFDASTSFSAGLNASSTQAFGFGDITTSTVGRFERSTTTGLVSFQMQGVSSASTTFNIGHASASFRIRGAAGQTAAIQEWRNSSETVLASVSAAGDGSFKGLVTAGPVTLGYGSTSDPLTFNHQSYAYGYMAAVYHRIALGAGTTGDALFTAATPAAARTTLGVRTITKSADQSKTSDATYADDSELKDIPLEAGKSYKIEFFIAAYLPPTEGGKARLIVPLATGTTPIQAGLFNTTQWSNGNASAISQTASGAPAGTRIFQLAASAGFNQNRAITGVAYTGILASSGNLSLQWAQNTSGVNATILLASSLITVTEL